MAAFCGTSRAFRKLCLSHKLALHEAPQNVVHVSVQGAPQSWKLLQELPTGTTLGTVGQKCHGFSVTTWKEVSSRPTISTAASSAATATRVLQQQQPSLLHTLATSSGATIRAAASTRAVAPAMAAPTAWCSLRLLSTSLNSASQLTESVLRLTESATQRARLCSWLKAWAGKQLPVLCRSSAGGAAAVAGGAVVGAAVAIQSGLGFGRLGLPGAGWKGILLPGQSVAACEQVYVPRIDVVDSNDWGSLALWVRRMWVPIVLAVWMMVAWDYPGLLVSNLLVLAWATKPSQNSVYAALEERRLQKVLETEGLEQLKRQLNPVTAFAKVEFQDYVLFNVATAIFLHERVTLIGALGDWWTIKTVRPMVIGLRPLMAQENS